MASETVVSHNMIVSGLLPKHMGWSDEVMRDIDNVLGYGAGAIVTVGDLSTTTTYTLLVEAEGYPKLGDYMHAKSPGTIVANFGEKGYQVESMAASSSDYLGDAMGSKKKTSDPSRSTGRAVDRQRTAASGGNVPDLHRERQSLQDQHRQQPTTDATPPPPLNDYYGTDADKPAWLYPEDGRYGPGSLRHGSRER